MTDQSPEVETPIKREGETLRSLEIIIAADEVESATLEAARSMAQRLNLPGFRKGKVPLAVVRKRFAQDLQEQVLEQLASRHVSAILDKSQEAAVGLPRLKEHAFREDGSLRILAHFEVQPPVVLGEYRQLEASRPGSRVEDDEVNEALESLRKGMTRLHPVETRGAQEGDDVLVDMKGQHLTGPDKGSTFQREGLSLRLEGDDVHPDLWRALVGAQAGFTRDATIEYPDDYRTPALAGRSIRYDLEVKAVREPRVPDLNDDLAREAGDFDTLEALRQRVAEDLGRRKKHHAEEAVRQALLRQLLERHEFQVPAVVVEHEVRQRLESMAHELARQGVDPTQAGVDWAKEKERQEARVREDVRATRILDAIAEAESIQATEEDVEKRLEEEAQRHGKPLAALRSGWEKEGRIEALRRHLGREAVLDFLISVGHIHDEGESA